MNAALRLPLHCASDVQGSVVRPSTSPLSILPEVLQLGPRYP